MTEHVFKPEDKALYKTWTGSGKDYHETEVPVTIVRLGPVRIRIQHVDGREQWCERFKLRPVDAVPAADVPTIVGTSDPKCARWVSDPAGVGADLFAIATAIEEHGNRGYSRREIESWGLNLQLDVLECEAAWKDILFCAEPNRNSDYSGWGVRKSLYWKLIWGNRYSWTSDIGQRLMDEAWEAAFAEYEKRRIRRRMEESSAGGAFEDMPTQLVAYRAACAHVLMRRYRRFRWNTGSLDSNPYFLMIAVFSRLYEEYVSELHYRTKEQPMERASKKKTQAAREDFAQAAKYYKDGCAHLFFSEAFVEQAISMAEEPDLTVDFEHLPKLPETETPVAWKSDAEVVKDFMRFLDEGAPGSFEWEDAQLILKQLRATLTRARGQKADAVIRREEELTGD